MIDLSGQDLELLTDIVQQLRHGWGRLQAEIWAKQARPRSDEVAGAVVLPVIAALWDRSEPLMRELIPRLAFVEGVEPISWIGDPAAPDVMRGWRVLCRDQQGAA